MCCGVKELHDARAHDAISISSSRDIDFDLLDKGSGDSAGLLLSLYRCPLEAVLADRRCVGASRAFSWASASFSAACMDTICDFAWFSLTVCTAIIPQAPEQWRWLQGQASR